MTKKRTTTLNIDRGKQVDRLKFDNIPKSFQGGNYTLLCDDNKPTHVKLSYNLCDHFELFRNDIDDEFTGLGYSNLFYNEEKQFKLTVTYPNAKVGKSKAFISCEKNKDGRIRSFIISFSIKMRIDDAVKVGNSIMSDFFDKITFYYRIPIAHKCIDVYARDTKKLLRKYVTIPYTTPLTLNLDVFKSQTIPGLFSPYITKFREGMNSISPLYRCLCYFSTYEGLQKIKGEITKSLKAKGKTVHRVRLIIEDSPFTREACPSYIGNKVDKFFQHYIQKQFRNSIAHMFDNNSTSPIRPMAIEIIHTLDTANQVMSRYLPVIIQQEIDFYLAEKAKLQNEEKM
jgi:hypothetical protein